MGWSSFESLPITFTRHPWLSGEVEENYHNADQYRVGLEYRHSDTLAFQAGALYDNTPQPPNSMSRCSATATARGFHRPSWSHGKMRSDIGYMYLPFEERSTEGQQLEGYDGSYETLAHLFGASMTLTF
jgi:long-chain fatty acid transport protein